MAFVTRTQEEINDKIQRLLISKEKIKPVSFFGDDNHLAIDMMIRILRGDLDDDNEIYDNEDSLGINLTAVLSCFQWLEDDEIDEEEFLFDE
jgi:hypothetical protein